MDESGETILRLRSEKRALELQIDALKRWIRNYSECDCDKRKKPGQPHWFACRRKLADDLLFPDGNVQREKGPLVDQLEESNRLNHDLKMLLAAIFLHFPEGSEPFIDNVRKKVRETVRPKSAARLDTCENYRNDSGDVVSRFCSTFEDHGTHVPTCQFAVKRVDPSCFVCGAEATGKIGAEPRCERHV